MQILQTPTFRKMLKKLHDNQKKDLDKAIDVIAANPLLGNQQKGDLSDVYVYKFSMVKQQVLIAYQFNQVKQTIVLLALGSHENFYLDLK